MMDTEKLSNLNRVLKEFSEEYVKRLKAKLEENGHRATGSLINSLKTEVENTASSLRVILVSNYYLKYVDYGRRAKQPKPPFKAIRDWLDVKNIEPTGATANLPTEKKLDSLAYAIQNSIAEKGALAKYGYGGHGGAYSDKVLDEMLPIYAPKFEEALKTDLNIEAKAMIDDMLGAIRL